MVLMLRQRVDTQQRLVPPGPLPVRLDLTTAKDGPFPDELKSQMKSDSVIGWNIAS